MLPTGTIIGPWQSSRQRGSIYVKELIASGSFGHVHNADYLYDLRERPLQVAVKFVHVPPLKTDSDPLMHPDINGVPKFLNREISIQASGSRCGAIVRVLHAAELRPLVVNSDHIRFLLRADKTGGRWFALCFPRYVANLWQQLMKEAPSRQRTLTDRSAMDALKLNLWRFFQIKEAVDWLHDHERCVHGDIQLRNILVRPYDIGLTDFGWSARFADKPVYAFTDLWTIYPPEGEKSKKWAGIPSVLSNEARSVKEWKAYDYWQLGITLLQMLESVQFPADQWMEHTHWSKLNGDFTALTDTVNQTCEASPTLKSFVQSFLTHDRFERYAGVLQLTHTSQSELFVAISSEVLKAGHSPSKG